MIFFRASGRPIRPGPCFFFPIERSFYDLGPACPAVCHVGVVTTDLIPSIDFFSYLSIPPPFLLPQYVLPTAFFAS
jgi:hypothetical protein